MISLHPNSFHSKIRAKEAQSMAVVFKAWEDLTIRDDFMFKAVMMSRELCMGVLEAILNEPIHDIKYLGEEVSLKAGYVSKGVRQRLYRTQKDHHHLHLPVRPLPARLAPLLVREHLPPRCDAETRGRCHQNHSQYARHGRRHHAAASSLHGLCEQRHHQREPARAGA